MPSLIDLPAPNPHNVPPQTPERGRTRTRRYPPYLSHQVDSEGKPRPLLHRRGTSHMYETLEDLLKEAGYKETRIFTPEMERREAAQENARKRDIGAVGGAVVKMFSTWMSRKSVPDLGGDAPPPSCPPSPLAHRGRPPLSNLATQHLQPLPRSSNPLLTPLPPNSSKSPVVAPQNQQHSLTRPPLASSSSTLTTTTAFPNSRAHLALRHAASTPQIDKRRVRTQPRPSRLSKAQAPPLPSTWLESLSAALLNPRMTPPSSPSAAAHPSKSIAHPSKLTVHSSRTPTSVAVTITNVVCRSAPSSRSSSAVRPPSSRKNKARVPVPVPTLAQTCVCEEQAAATAWPPYSPHHLPHDDASALLPVDDDEDDELNLTMMLIPSKRQHSIRSLRSVLQHHHSIPSPASAAQAREEYERIMRRRINESEEDEGETEAEGEGHWDSGEFLTAKIKRRRSNLPRQWGWAN